MTNKELKAILQGLGLKKSGKKAELVDRILGREIVPEKKKKPQWRNSKARALLEKMLMDKHSPVHKMTWREIHASHPWFQEFEDLTNFRDNVKRLREANEKKIKVVQKDNQIIQRELQKFPRNSRTNRGEPFWDTHAAKLLLRMDVKAGKHLKMKPRFLHKTRPEYLAFSLPTFRKHIYQEKRHQKELPMRVSRRNKKAQHKYDAELRREIPNWNLQVGGEDDDDNNKEGNEGEWEEYDNDNDELLDDDNDSDPW